MGRNIFHLSGGEKQKIACAGVSIMEPDVLVMDEPSSNLDASSILDFLYHNSSLLLNLKLEVTF